MKYLYYPVLKWKKGEQIALSNLSNQVKGLVKPILEIVADVEVEEFLSELGQYENIDSFYIDTSYIDEGESGTLEEIVRLGKSHNKRIIPALNYYDFKTRLSNFEELCEEIVVKVTIPTDFDGDSYDEIFNFINEASKENLKIICFLDLGIITKRQVANTQYAEVSRVLTNHLTETKIDEIIISITSFPEDVSDIPSGGEAFYDRYEINLLKAILKNFSIKNISFSDYGVTKFTESEIDFSKLRYGILPKARYTLEDKYWVLKGKRDNRTREMVVNHRVLAQTISSSEHYYGIDFSFGDLDIKERALGHKYDNPKKVVGPGGNTNWVTNAVSHHITVVANTLSKMNDSLTET